MKLTKGIKDEVEDLSAVFKKMAKLKSTPILLKFPADFDPFADDFDPFAEKAA